MSYPDAAGDFVIDDSRDAALADAVLDGDVPAKSILTARDKGWTYDWLNHSKSGGLLPMLGTSSKISAGEGIGVLTRVLYMMPARSSGTNACPFASAGCEASCLAEQTGRMSMSGPQRARRRRHASFILDRERFMEHIAEEVTAHVREANAKGMRAAIRLNGTTDILWERIPVRGFKNIMEAFPAVQFYDYTKVPLKGRKNIPANYHLTYSLSERGDANSHALDYIAAGYSVAVVFAAKKGQLPAESKVLRTIMPLPVIDGDKNDCRFLDAPGSIVGLSAKGRALSDTSGFVKAAA